MIDSNKIQYYTMCVSAFSDKKGMTKKDAFNYLFDHYGIEFLVDHYDAEHTLSLDDAIDDLTMICKNNGGAVE
jgi:hypothetical protein